MTCIVGLVDGGRVYIGGDSAGVRGLSLSVRKDEKVFKNGEFIFGFTSSFRMGQILRYSLKTPKFEYAEKELFEFMCTDFIDAVRCALKDGGFAKIDSNEDVGGEFLVGGYGRLFTVFSDFQVGEMAGGFAAAGCGESYAIGAMHILKDQDISPSDKILKALEVSEICSAGVSSPFVVHSI